MCVRACVRSGDSAGPYSLGSVGSGGPEFNGVLLEVSGVDITRFSETLMGYGIIGTSSTSIETLSAANSLFLSFAGGDPQNITISSPTPAAVNNNNGSSVLLFDYDNSTGGWNSLVASIASGSAGALVMSLAGV